MKTKITYRHRKTGNFAIVYNKIHDMTGEIIGFLYLVNVKGVIIEFNQNDVDNDDLFEKIHVEIPDTVRIKTQQGSFQHILELSKDDAKIYTDILTRNGLWWVDVTERKKI
jgi:hypothetical protein